MNRRLAMKQLLALSTMLATVARAAPSAAVQDRRFDLEIMRRALELHPGLYRYNSPAEIESRLARLAPRYEAATLAEAFLLLSEFTATIRCGHTYCNFFNQRKAVADALFDRRTRLPFEFRWIDGEMVASRPHAAAPGIPPGTVVETVDGRPVRALLDQLMPYVRADGANDGKRRSLLSVQGTSNLETFDVFHGLVAPPTGAVFRLSVRRPDGSRHSLEVPAITLEERRAMRPARPKGAEPIWTWSMRPDGVAILTMPDWAMYSSAWKDWRPWLDDRLSSLDGARALIVDLRANEGGDDVGDRILARVATSDLEFDDEIQKLRFRRTPRDLDPYLETWDESFRTLGENAAALAGGFYRRGDVAATQRIAARGPRVRVPVAVMVGPVNSSATFQFARRAQQTGLVRLFGTETGGNRRGINGGAYFFVRLPASGIEFDLPLVGYFPTTPQPDAGVVPDVIVPETVEDVALGRDRTLEAALAWARG